MKLSSKNKLLLTALVVVVIILLCIYAYNPKDGMYSASQQFLEDSGLVEGHILIGDMSYIYATNDKGVIADGSAKMEFGLPQSLGFNRRYSLTIGENPLLPESAIAEFDYKKKRLTIYDVDEKTILFDGYYNSELNADT